MSIIRLITIAMSFLLLNSAFALDKVPTSPNQTVVAKQPSTPKVNINQASAQELLKVTGLNASKVRAIISFRKKQGQFKSLDQLSEVKGMKRLKPLDMKMIQDQLEL